jgi:hypothetical protein
MSNPAAGRLPSCTEDNDENGGGSSSNSSAGTSLSHSRSGESPIAFGGLSPEDQVAYLFIL